LLPPAETAQGWFSGCYLAATWPLPGSAWVARPVEARPVVVRPLRRPRARGSLRARPGGSWVVSALAVLAAQEGLLVIAALVVRLCFDLWSESQTFSSSRRFDVAVLTSHSRRQNDQ
jgi:hypothetical protein